MWSNVSTPPTPSGWERGMSKNTPEELAGAPGSKGKGGPSLPEREEIERLKELLKDVRIEVTGPAEINQQLGDALYEAVDEVVKRVADGLHLKIFECDEEPDDVIYASGTGFKWTRTTWCLGIIKGYHVIADAVSGFNSGGGRAVLKGIELVKGDPNERGE